MPKSQRPVPRKSPATPEDKDHALTQSLCQLALEVAEQEDGETLGAALGEQAQQLQKLVRKLLHQNKDTVLYEAIELARDEDVGAYQLLRASIEEAAATVVVRRDAAPPMEINAFLIPLFVHSTGGLRKEQECQDADGFEALVASIQQGQLESAKAKVVLMRHIYDLGEIDSITYCHLHDMVRDAHASLTEKKLAATPALERSVGSWAGGDFGPQDAAMELRFLLGFALKRVDDPFYAVPAEEAAADDYFAARMERYRQWTLVAADLVKRCLAPAGTPLECNFLYQDLFFGGKEQGMREYFMLQTMADMNQALQQHRLTPGQVGAIVAPADVNGAMVMRVSLTGHADGALLCSSDQPLDLGADLQDEVDDLCDALLTIGVTDLSVAPRFDASGAAPGARPYRPR
ncbi:MAG: hypothetical protein V4754_17230 [Pseudomonadota bacterium]